ncbi:hypothetical protein BGW42_006258 [Actinomortierella wolfii]|nr:hypothetical protein BGW42_006258 [Actinomortierella wolfii]
MTMPQLPIECIALTIKYIGDCGDSETLLSLLLVSRAVSREAAAVLYRNPIRFLGVGDSSASDTSSKGTPNTQAKKLMALFRLLARCLPDHLQSPFLKKTFALDPPVSCAAAAATATEISENGDVPVTNRCGDRSRGSNIQEDDLLHGQAKGLSRAVGDEHHSSATAPSPDDRHTTTTKAEGLTSTCSRTVTPMTAAVASAGKHADCESSSWYGPPTINYLAFLTDYNWTRVPFPIGLEINQYCPWRDVIELDEDPSQRASTVADVNDIHPGSEDFLEYIDNAKDHEESFYLLMCATAKLTTILRLMREMAWAVYQVKMESLRSCKIHLRDIDRFQELIVQRGSQLQTLFIVVPAKEPIIERYPEAWEKIEPLIRQHTNRHPGVLKEIRVVSVWADELTDHPTLSRYYWSWYTLLPPCSPPPDAIVPETVKRILPRWDETDYSKVSVIHLPPTVFKWLDTKFVEGILPRCRRLRQLSTKLSANAFQWAIDELSGSALEGTQDSSNTYRTDWSNASTSNNYNNNRKYTIPKPIRPAPLSMLQCTVSIHDVQKLIRDATWAFHFTLATVNIHAMVDNSYNTSLQTYLLSNFQLNGMSNVFPNPNPSANAAPDEICIGHDWKLGNIHSLQLTTGFSAHLKLHRDFFAGCTSMRELKLCDRSLEYDATKVVPCRISKKDKGAMRELQILDLCGMPALMFNPRILRDVPNLKRLEIGWPHDNDMYFVTPVQEDELGNDYEVNPDAILNSKYDDEDDDEDDDYDGASLGSLFSMKRGWTWDWYLPSLTYLHLSGDWALRCRLRLLAGCPLLQELQMSMDNRLGIARHVTVRGIHEAVALGRLRQLHLSVDEKDDSPFVLLPNLRKLDIFGPWHFGPGAFELFFSILSPNIQTMMIPSSKGFTVEQLIRVTSKMPNLQLVNFPWLFRDEDDPDNYGLELIESYEWNTYRSHLAIGTAGRGTGQSERPQILFNTMGLFYRLHS